MARVSSLLPSTSSATAASSAAGVGQRAGRGQRLLHRGQIALEGWVHRPPPAAPAAAPVGLGPHGGDGLVDEVLVVGGLDLPADDPFGGGQHDLPDPGRHLLDGGLAGDDHLGVGGLHDPVVDWPGRRPRR